MKATITNLGTVAVPLTSTEGKGFAASLEPGVPYSLDFDWVTVAVVGDNPSFMEDLGEALKDLKELAIKLIVFWRSHPQPHEGGSHPVVSIRVAAATGNDIRATGDDKNLDVEITGGGTNDVTMKDYIELRQLGVSGAATQPEAP